MIQNQTYGGLKIKPIESLKSNPNNTNNNTDISNTDSIQINSVDEFNKRIELNGIENNRKSISEIQEEVTMCFEKEQTLPYIYTSINYHRHLKQAIYLLTEYEWYKSNAEDKNIDSNAKSKNTDYFSTVHIFSEALYKMLSTEGNQTIGNRNITYSKVYDALINYIKNMVLYDMETGKKRTEFLVRDLMSDAILNYQTASKINKIKYPVAYMSTCILTAMENGEAKINDLIRYDFQ